MKKSIISLGAIGVLSLGIFGFSALPNAYAAENLTPKTSCSMKSSGNVMSLMEEGLSFEDAKKKNIEIKFSNIDKSVKNGSLTPEKAAELKKQIQEKSKNCTTPGQNKKGNCSRSGQGKNVSGCNLNK
ncbi:MAG: hypothetical protein RR515_01715 [Clostridium sp.]